MRFSLLLLSLAAALSSCAQTRQFYPGGLPAYREGFIQGWVGVTEISQLDLGIGAGDSLRDGESATLPVIGGAIGEFFGDLGIPNLRWGVEGGFSYYWDRSRDLVVSGTGLNPDTVRTDLDFVDAFVGLSADLAIGSRLSWYAGVGPLLQYAELEIESDSGEEDFFDNGFGLGWYVRTGLEFEVYAGGWIGLGIRWVDSQADLGSGAGDSSIEASQIFFGASGRW